MELGTFSVSLAVKDLAASRAFYETLGFEQVGGSEEHSYLILQNGGAVIGLFHGFFEGHILTFNPGWSGPHEEVEGDFTDVRAIARTLEEAGIELATKQLDGEEGPASFAVMDPDGNAILVDQHR